MHKRALLLFCIVLLLGQGCMPLAPKSTELVVKPVTPQPVEEPDSVDVSALQNEIAWLLDKANMALRADRLTTPLDDNAYFGYLRVLSLDPENQQAEQGIANIVERYLTFAIDRAHAGATRPATEFLNNAKSIDPEHPNIPAVTRLIEDRRTTSSQRHRIPLPSLDRRAPDLADNLSEIGKNASEAGVMVVITARTDAEGRWIYQQLNSETETRVRARFELGSAPSILLVNAGTR